MNYRLYPTYKLSARDHRLCGVASWTPNNSGFSKADRTLPTPHSKRNSSTNVSARNNKVASEEQSYMLKTQSQLDPSTLYLLHVRFPVIKLLRTNEDTYATLICSPNSKDHPGALLEEDNNYQEDYQGRELRVDVNELLPPEIKDKYNEQGRSATEQSLTRYNDLGDDSNEPIVEESQQHQQRVQFPLANLTLETEKTSKKIISEPQNYTEKSASSSISPILTTALLSTITTEATNETKDRREIVLSTSKSQSDEQQAIISIPPSGIEETKNINKSHSDNKLNDGTKAIIRSGIDNTNLFSSLNITTTLQKRHVTANNHGKGNISSGKWPSSPLIRGGGSQRSSFIINSQLGLFVLAIMSSLLIIALILAIIVDNL